MMMGTSDYGDMRQMESLIASAEFPVSPGQFDGRFVQFGQLLLQLTDQRFPVTVLAEPGESRVVPASRQLADAPNEGFPLPLGCPASTAPLVLALHERNPRHSDPEG